MVAACDDCGAALPKRRVTLGKLSLCEPCFEKRDSSKADEVFTCKRCEKDLAGSDVVTTAVGDRYHKDCFLCDGCAEPLSNTYYNEPEGNLCQTCVDLKDALLAKTCHRCKELIPVTETYISTSPDQHYHNKCFVCCRCYASLADGTYYPQNDEVCCSNCVSRLPDKICSGCNSPIATGDKYMVTDDDQRFHKRCFRCCECTEELGGTYYSRPEGMYCSSCLDLKRGADTQRFQRLMSKFHIDDTQDGQNNRSSIDAPLCPDCNEFIRSSEEQIVTAADGVAHHKKCFACLGCKETLLGAYYVVDGNRFCKQCAQNADEANSKDCAECGKKVGRGEKAVTTANGDVFHCACFSCHHCRGPLEEYFTRPEGRYCKQCCLKGYDKRSSMVAGDRRMCVDCQQAISGREAFISLKSGFYHRTCLVCSSCHAMLPGGFYDGRLCHTCYHKQNLERPKLSPAPPRRPRGMSNASVEARSRGASPSDCEAADKLEKGIASATKVAELSATDTSSTRSGSSTGLAAGLSSGSSPTPSPRSSGASSGTGVAVARAAVSAALGWSAASVMASGERLEAGSAETNAPKCFGCKAELSEFFFPRPEGKYCRVCIDEVRKRRQGQSGGLTCAECRKEVSGAERFMKTADGLILHKGCFRCCRCNTHLNGAFFTGPKGRYCRDCMMSESATKHCTACSGLIGCGEKYITTAAGGKYHERCFLCTSCRAPCIGHFFIRSDGRFCPPCHGAALGPRDCAACQRLIAGGERFVHDVQGGTFHEECFKCRVCDKIMKGAFYQFSQTGVCVECQDEKVTLRECHKCKKDVASAPPPVLTTDGRCFHSECSSCQLCRAPIGGARSAVVVARHAWADIGEGEKTPVECSKCRGIVKDGDEYILAPNGKDYHLSCFTCEGCTGSIVGPFHERSRGRFCRECVYMEDCSMFCSSCKVNSITTSKSTSLCKACAGK